MLASIAKSVCFQPVTSSLRSNFPKLVFGHLHLSNKLMIDDALICWHCPGECDNQFDNGIFIHCDDAPNVRCLFQHIQHNYAGHGINQFIRGCNTEQTQDFCHYSNGEVSFGFN